ncbi:DUF397 domain-containing protein [Streptomyces sp. NPDC050610]|uniref:DUF397 domain-containing protein n=1 Tax=Streptomyces sp. NPDC050610 TaxID=3157097 RepID=UPI0034289684
MPPLHWQKSTFSENQANCVELATSPSGLHLREGDEPETVVTVTRAELRTFVRAIRTGAFDHHQ